MPCGSLLFYGAGEPEAGSHATKWIVSNNKHMKLASFIHRIDCGGQRLLSPAFALMPRGGMHGSQCTAWSLSRKGRAWEGLGMFGLGTSWSTPIPLVVSPVSLTNIL